MTIFQETFEMGKAIPYDYRVKIIARMKLGEQAKDLANEMGYSEGGVKKIWYAYKKRGKSAFKNNYSNCGRMSIYNATVRQKVKEIRDNSQGGGYVRSKLEQKFPNQIAPSERTLQRWWLAEGTNRKKGKPTASEKKVESIGS